MEYFSYPVTPTLRYENVINTMNIYPLDLQGKRLNIYKKNFLKEIF